MSWAVRDYAHANHNPVVEVNGQAGSAPIAIEAQAGEPVLLDASQSHDPDAQKLSYHWFQYIEAAATDPNHAVVTLTGSDSSTATATSGLNSQDMVIPSFEALPLFPSIEMPCASAFALRHANWA